MPEADKIMFALTLSALTLSLAHASFSEVTTGNFGKLALNAMRYRGTLRRKVSYLTGLDYLAVAPDSLAQRIDILQTQGFSNPRFGLSRRLAALFQ
jgi:hypothetical protein